MKTYAIKQEDIFEKILINGGFDKLSLSTLLSKNGSFEELKKGFTKEFYSGYNYAFLGKTGLYDRLRDSLFDDDFLDDLWSQQFQKGEAMYSDPNIRIKTLL